MVRFVIHNFTALKRYIILRRNLEGWCAGGVGVLKFAQRIESLKARNETD